MQLRGNWLTWDWSAISTEHMKLISFKIDSISSLSMEYIILNTRFKYICSPEGNGWVANYAWHWRILHILIQLTYRVFQVGKLEWMIRGFISFWCAFPALSSISRRMSEVQILYHVDLGFKIIHVTHKLNKRLAFVQFFYRITTASVCNKNCVKLWAWCSFSCRSCDC